MTRIAVFTTNLSLAGGGEAVTLSIAKTLEEAGYIVDVITYKFDKDLEKVFELISPNYRPRRIIVYKAPKLAKLLNTRGKLARLRGLILVDILVNHLIEKIRENYDLIIDTSSNILTKADVIYVQNITWQRSNRSEIYWKLYEKLIERTSKVLLNRPKPKIVFCNSSWTAKNFKSLNNNDVKVKILYPPVDVKYFSEVANNIRYENIIVTVSRFAPEKNLDKIVDIANDLKEEFKFIIIGGRGEYSEPVISKLNAKIKKLKINNVELLVNVPRSKLRKILSIAKYYLHPPLAEPFGIAVVEAMSAGLIPIVYRDGGAWYDIVSKVSDILGYSNVSEVPSIIKKIEKSKDVYIELRKKSIEVANLFTYEKFKKVFLRELEEVLTSTINV